MQAMERIEVPPAEPQAWANIMPRYAIEHAAWIWHPALRADEVAVLRFTRTFHLDTPATVRLHVSADQRYELSVDGRFLSAGPHRGDLFHWSFASFEITFEPGEHTLDALVWWIGDWLPAAQVTHRGGFICAGEGLEDQINTGQAHWQVQRLAGWSFKKPELHAYHVIGPAQTIDGRQWLHPQEPPQPASVIVPPIRTSWTGIVQGAWQLHPSPLPEMLRRTIRPGAARAVTAHDPRTTPLAAADEQAPERATWDALLREGSPVEIGPHQTRHILWDLGDYYCGYGGLSVSGGADSEISFEWAEALFELLPAPGEQGRKGHRDVVAGKRWLGFGDRFLPEGSAGQAYRSHWWRSGRYVLLSIRTGEQPLRLDDLHLLETRYPYDDASHWASDDPALDGYVPIAKRGLWMCSHETYMDCPYYEQLMYVGDGRLEMLTAYVAAQDDRLTRRGIELFDWSRYRTGFVAERYPSTPYQLSLTFSMLWVGMVHDYAFWRDDPDWVRQRLVGVRSLLEHFFHLLEGKAFLEGLPGWPFVDWVPGWPGGVPADGREGASSVINLLFIQCLQHAAALEEAYGETGLGERYREVAEQLGDRLVERFWDERTGRLADDLPHREFSEHAQCLALLTGILDERQRGRALRSLLQDQDLHRATVYFSFYVLEALYRAGEAEALFQRFDFWKQLREQGFRTPIEKPEPSRSDCHAWGSHPLFHYHASLAGVRPAAPGFETVVIAPAPGPLGRIESTLPHPRGSIETRLRFDHDARRCEGAITLPPQTTGTFRWAGQSMNLQPGRNPIEVGQPSTPPSAR